MAKVMACGAAGVIELEIDDSGLVPALLVAVTLNVYARPLVRPVTTTGELAPWTGATSAGLEVTV
ncbi:hypothetical protein D3C81_1196970 [compost metagenome]